MAKKIILTGILAIALVFAMTVLGCDDNKDSNKGNENNNSDSNNNNSNSNDNPQTGEDTTFDPQQLIGKWQSPSWESLLSPEDGPNKAIGFEYLPSGDDSSPKGSHPNNEDLFAIYHKEESGGGLTCVSKEYFSLKQNIFYKNYQNVPLFSCSISGDTLTLTAITLGDWSSRWDMEPGKIFFVGKKVEKFAWK